MLSSEEIRSGFLDFFRNREHTIERSDTLVPGNDPTLLFTSAGMVQFKPYYSGEVRVPYRRAATSQKCLRAGGKANDLDEVGKTSRHMTGSLAAMRVKSLKPPAAKERIVSSNPSISSRELIIL